MKSFKNNRLLSLLVVFVFLLGIVMPGQTQAVGQKVNYVALGDSLAAGQTPFKTPEGNPNYDKGFSGVIAEHFEKNGTLGSYSNKFAVSGHRTDQVLKDILDNREVEEKKIKDTIKEANYITVTAGANDVLQIAQIDKLKRTISIDPLEFGITNLKIQNNLRDILKEIENLNPKAEVYVSGYYNPFPYSSAEQQVYLELMLSHLNDGIQKAATESGATFVSMDGIFVANKEKYLPNPEDIHPSLDGYQLLANNFIHTYSTMARFNFVDVPVNYSGLKEIKFLVTNKKMTGISDTHFAPEQAVTRADAAVAIMNILPFEKLIPEDPSFSDVPQSHPAYTAIASLTKAGVFMKAEKFNPNNPLTRGQMAKILTLAFKLKATQQSKFKDVKNNNPVKPYVDALLSAKITTGYPDLTFKPNVQTSRGHFAQFLYRASKNVTISTVKY